MAICAQCASEIPDGASTCKNCESGEAAALLQAPLFRNAFAATENLDGLSGWLILLGASLVVAPCTILWKTVSIHVPLFTHSNSRAFLNIHPGVEALLVFEVISNVVFVFCLLGLIYLFFKKKRSFPTYMVLYLIMHLCMLVLDSICTLVLIPSAGAANISISIGRTLVGSSIWIPYCLVSKRVKATFTR